MVTPENLLSLAKSYAEANGVPLVTVSFRAFGDSKKLAAIQAGADVTTRRYASALHWFSDNWPADTAWPTGIARPAPSQSEGAAA